MEEESELSFPVGQSSSNREAVCERFESLFAAKEGREHLRTYLEGRLLEEAGNYHKAALEYEKAVKLDKSTPSHWCVSSGASARLGSMWPSKSVFSRASGWRPPYRLRFRIQPSEAQTTLIGHVG